MYRECRAKKVMEIHEARVSVDTCLFTWSRRGWLCAGTGTLQCHFYWALGARRIHPGDWQALRGWEEVLNSLSPIAARRDISPAPSRGGVDGVGERKRTPRVSVELMYVSLQEHYGGIVKSSAVLYHHLLIKRKRSPTVYRKNITISPKICPFGLKTYVLIKICMERWMAA